MIDDKKPLGYFALGFTAACVMLGTLSLATKPEQGWVCADFANDIIADAQRVGRSFLWVDPNGVSHTVSSVSPEWYCVKSEYNARQMVRPPMTDVEKWR